MFLPGGIKGWLEKQKWYLKARYAKPVLNAWLQLRPAVKKELQQQGKLYLSLLHSLDASSKLVFDIGANEGFLAAIFAKAGYKVIAIEPAKRNIAILKSRFSDNASITVIEAAVSNEVGEMKFYETEKSHAFGTASEKWKNHESKDSSGVTYRNEPLTVTAVTIDHLISQYGLPAFIKIDVEGHEEFALRGLTQKIPLISFEAILPAFIQETESCIKHLTKLSEDAVFNFAVDNYLQWDDFDNGDRFRNEMKQLPPQTIEIFCKM